MLESEVAVSSRARSTPAQVARIRWTMAHPMLASVLLAVYFALFLGLITLVPARSRFEVGFLALPAMTFVISLPICRIGVWWVATHRPPDQADQP